MGGGVGRRAGRGGPVSGFSADWLALREPFDAAARTEAEAVAAFACAAGGGAARQVVDLACGTGANLRALAPRLGPGQQWRLVDVDAALLAAVPAALRAWGQPLGYRIAAQGEELDAPLRLAGPGFDATVTRQALDLVGGLGALPLPPGGLVTASALLDLVSAAWLAELVDRAEAARATLLFTLSVDGRIAWDPADAADAVVQAAFAAHQRRDKGFGPALGASAAAWAEAHLAARGWRTCSGRSDWRIDGARAPALLQALVDGSAAAAIEQAPAQRAEVQVWQRRRSALCGRTRLVIGHVDLAAGPRQ